MTVSTQTVFKISLLNIVALARKNTKMALSLPHTFDLAVFYEAFGQLYESLLITKALKAEAWVHKYTFSMFVVILYGFCLSTAYIAHQHHPYMESP